MSNLLLIHHSDQLIETFQPQNPKRPVFYWYSDRFVSYIGTKKYTYLILVNPEADNIEVRSRSSTEDFDMLHKNFLHYKGWREGTHPDWCTCNRPFGAYEESGIVMSFGEMKPTITLMARSLASGKEEWLQHQYEIIEPYQPFSKRIINLFEEPYDKEADAKPIPFNQIPELLDLVPELNDSLPFKDLTPDAQGKYHYEDWLPMNRPAGSWM